MVIELLDSLRGDGEPEEIVSACHGLQLTVSERPVLLRPKRVGWSGGEPTGEHADGYYVDIDEFLAKLEAQNPEAAQWYRDNSPGLLHSNVPKTMLGQVLIKDTIYGIVFGKQFCKVLSE